MATPCLAYSLHELFKLGDRSVAFAVETEPALQYHAPRSIVDPADVSHATEGLVHQFIDERTVTAPGRSLTYLKNVTVTPNAAIVTADHNIVLESCLPYVGEWLGRVFQPWLSAGATGMTAVLDNPEVVERPAVYVREHGEMGFYHWMHSVFPRVDVVTSLHLSRDYALLCPTRMPFQREGLEVAGLASMARIDPGPARPQFFRELLFPSPLVEAGDFWLRPPSVGGFYDNLSVPAAPHPRRVYLSRQDAGVRRLGNEARLLDLIGPLGFVGVEMSRLSFADQLALFRDCEFVIAPHGAAMSHIIGMRPGTSVLELLHPRRLWPTYRAIAARRGLRYGFVLGNDHPPDEPGDTFAFDVDLAKLGRVLKQFGL